MSKHAAQQAILRRKAALSDRRWAGQDVRMVGDRKAFTALARQMVAEAKAEIQADFAQDVEFRRKWIRTLKDGALAGDRTAGNIVAMIHDLTGNTVLLVIEFLKQKGLAGEEELDSILQLAKSTEGADLLTAIERCTAFLEGALPLHEEHRGVVVRRLGGYLPVAMDENPIPGA